MEGKLIFNYMFDLKFTDILDFNKRSKLNTKEYNIGILSNITVNTIVDILEYGCKKNNINPNIEIGNYDNIIQDSESEEFKKKDLVIIFYDIINIIDHIDTYFENINEDKFNLLVKKTCNDINLVLNNLQTIPSVVINTFSSTYFQNNTFHENKLDLFTDRINNFILNSKKQHLNLNILNLNKVVAQIGVSNSFDQRLYNSSKAPYSFLFFKSYVDSLTNILLKNTALLKKAIIFDCDNTLWSGIIGEEEIDFSKDSDVGKHFYKVQQVIKFLSKNGIIIGLNSKNNEKDVLPFLNEINGILTNEDITIYKINWDNKINNLLQIAKDLNISLDSIIFIDDSSFEIQLVNSKLPEILTMQVPKKLYLYPKFLLNIVEKYCNLNFNKDDLNKNLMYKQEFDRKHLLTKFDNINDYLKTLEIEIDIKINDKNNIIRLSQLSLKTNQFNLTNKRYTESEFYNLMNSNNYLIFSLFVKDKFGESGTTGIIIIQQDQLSKTAIIENYLLSCRILGREIEIVFMNCIIEYLQNINFKILKATYIKSNKNNQVIEFYDKIGFKILSDEDNYSKLYQLNLEKYISKDCNNIKINKLWIKN